MTSFVCFGSTQIALLNDNQEIFRLVIHLPKYHAPTHCASVGSMPGSRFGYGMRVQIEPRMNPAAGPKIRTPMVMAFGEIYKNFEGLSEVRKRPKNDSPI